MTRKKPELPLEHVIDHQRREVWVACTSAISAMGLPALVRHWFPGYGVHIGSKEALERLHSQASGETADVHPADASPSPEP